MKARDRARRRNLYANPLLVAPMLRRCGVDPENENTWSNLSAPDKNKIAAQISEITGISPRNGGWIVSDYFARRRKGTRTTKDKLR